MPIIPFYSDATASPAPPPVIGDGDVIQMETGDTILMETGDRILME